jgi:hypothetical protein
MIMIIMIIMIITTVAPYMSDSLIYLQVRIGMYLCSLQYKKADLFPMNSLHSPLVSHFAAEGSCLVHLFLKREAVRCLSFILFLDLQQFLCTNCFGCALGPFPYSYFQHFHHTSCFFSPTFKASMFQLVSTHSSPCSLHCLFF